MQAFIGFQMVSGDLKPALPFAIEEMEIADRSVSTMWAHVRVRQDGKIEGKARKVDIDLGDEQGMILVRMKGVSFKVPEDEANPAEKTGTLMLEPVWNKRSDSFAGIITPEYSRHIVILCEMPGVTYQRVNGEMNGVRCIRLQTEEKEITNRFQSYASRVFQEIQAVLREHSDGKILFQVIVPQGGEAQLFQGLSGLLKTAGIENPRLVGQLIAIDRPERIVEILRENSCCPDDSQIRYQQGLRSVLAWQEIETVPEKGMAPWKDQGIYLITGGAGGLGMLFAGEIAHQARNVSLILTGRSSLSAEKQNRFKKLEAFGARVVYRSFDVSDREATYRLIREIREEFGGLDGIIHGAGVIKDNYIIKKSQAEVEAVLSPKITGLVNLDQASQDVKLDFFILFSSIAGALGNAGQADYATANAFMDAYADYRNRLMGSGRRQGRTLAVNWPLWKDGGMRIEAKTAQIMMADTGMMALESSTGFRAFYAGFFSGRSRLMVLEGHLERMRKTLASKKILVISSTVSKTGYSLADTGSGDIFSKNRVEKSPSVEKPAISPDVDTRERMGKAHLGISEAALREKAENYFKKLIAKAINLPDQQIEVDAPFEEYGIDSVMMLELNVRLGKNFGSLPQTLFFEYQNVKDLTGYFLGAHRERLLSLLETEDEAPAGATVGADSKARLNNP
ncbi:MAG TPA: hypothetical protein DDW50_02710 [Firmicutes bacterium]|nr:hypothetical protein [Bacillota bacterium]